MKRILLTGMSGTGKSSALSELAVRGYRTVDMDEPGWSEYAPDGDWVWSADRLHAILADITGEALFVSGCATNQGLFYPQFDAVILLSAPAATLIERLRTRTNNPYGKKAEQLAEVLAYRETVEPLLRKGADHEIVTTMPLSQVVEEIIAILAATAHSSASAAM